MQGYRVTGLQGHRVTGSGSQVCARVHVGTGHRSQGQRAQVRGQRPTGSKGTEVTGHRSPVTGHRVKGHRGQRANTVTRSTGSTRSQIRSTELHRYLEGEGLVHTTPAYPPTLTTPTATSATYLLSVLRGLRLLAVFPCTRPPCCVLLFLVYLHPFLTFLLGEGKG